jgi:hypothetical protein
MTPCKKVTCHPSKITTKQKGKRSRSGQRVTYLDLIYKTFGCTLHPRSLLRLCKLFMTNKLVPALAPHVDMLAAITGTTLDLLHVVVRGFPGLLIRRAVPGCGRRHYGPPA